MVGGERKCYLLLTLLCSPSVVLAQYFSDGYYRAAFPSYTYSSRAYGNWYNGTNSYNNILGGGYSGYSNYPSSSTYNGYYGNNGGYGSSSYGSGYYGYAPQGGAVFPSSSVAYSTSSVGSGVGGLFMMCSTKNCAS